MEITEKNNFFTCYYQNIKEAIGKTEIDGISLCKTDLERIEYLENLLNLLNNDLHLKKIYGKKNFTESLNYKAKANIAFQNEKWMEALTLYTKSLVISSYEKEEHVAILFANRSAALFHLRKFDESIIDIERALENGYPKEKIYKILERKSQCYLAKCDHINAIETFKKTISSLDDSKLSFEKRKQIERNALLMINLLEKNNRKNVVSEKPVQLKNNFVKENIMEEYISDVIKVDYALEEGRFIVASKDVEIGDEILVENPNVCVLLQKYSKTHCQNCFLRTMTPIACTKCSNVVFCSEKCLKDSTYHIYECGILPIFWKSGASINCHLALRIIASKPLQYFLDIKSELNHNPNFELLKKIPINDYRRVCNLVRHENKRNPLGFFQLALMARFLCKLLFVAGYFDDNPDQQIFLFIASLILRNIQLLQFNTHEISELLQKTNILSSTKTLFIGAGLYPTLALFNHSCDPGIVRYFKGTKVFVNAIKNIESGLQISENYGLIYAQTRKEERQMNLSTLYWFDCRCIACVENWPIYADMKNDQIPFRCNSGKKCNMIIKVKPDIDEVRIKCPTCFGSINILIGLKVMQDTEYLTQLAKKKFDAGDYKSALIKYVDILKMMTKVLVPPFTDYVQVQQNIRDCYLNLGNSYALN